MRFFFVLEFPSLSPFGDRKTQGSSTELMDYDVTRFTVVMGRQREALGKLHSCQFVAPMLAVNHVCPAIEFPPIRQRLFQVVFLSKSLMFALVLALKIRSFHEASHAQPSRQFKLNTRSYPRPITWIMSWPMIIG